MITMNWEIEPDAVVVPSDMRGRLHVSYEKARFCIGPFPGAVFVVSTADAVVDALSLAQCPAGPLRVDLLAAGTLELRITRQGALQLTHAGSTHDFPYAVMVRAAFVDATTLALETIHAPWQQAMVSRLRRFGSVNCRTGAPIATRRSRVG